MRGFQRFSAAPSRRDASSARASNSAAFSASVVSQPTTTPKRCDAPARSAHADGAAPYDLVISEGRVIDPETKFDAIRNIGVRDGRIAEISDRPLRGAAVIDARGLVVSPGFIDLHSHAVSTLPGARMQVMDGVTTALELESGVIPIPGTYETVAEEGRPLNYGFSAAWAFSRVVVVKGQAPETFSTADWADAYSRTDWHDLFTPAQTERVLKILEQGLRAGSLGVGANLGYMPGANAEEFYQIAQLAKRYDTPIFVHIRHNEPFGPENNYSSHEEVIALAAMTGAHMHFCHLNSNATRNIPVMIDAIEKARSYGLDVTWEAYPYGAASTMASAAYLAPDYLRSRWGLDCSAIQYIRTGERLDSLDKWAKLRKDDPAGLINAFLLDESKPEDKALLDQAVVHPDAAIASDAVFWQVEAEVLQGDIWPLPENTVGHPRAAGTFSRVVGRYVREGKLTLTEAIRKATLLPADILAPSTPQMKNKGRIRIGADADLAIFDAAKICDRATYEKPATPSIGIVHVLVNGVPVVSNGELDRNSMPGAPIRRSMIG